VQQRVSRDESAEATEGLAKGSNENVRYDAVEGTKAPAGGTQDTDGMCFVDDKGGVVCRCKR
jgi:hypothetical protein